MIRTEAMWQAILERDSVAKGEHNHPTRTWTRVYRVPNMHSEAGKCFRYTACEGNHSRQSLVLSQEATLYFSSPEFSDQLMTTGNNVRVKHKLYGVLSSDFGTHCTSSTQRFMWNSSDATYRCYDRSLRFNFRNLAMGALMLESLSKLAWPNTDRKKTVL